MEEGVEEEDDIGLDGDAVEKDRLWWCIERVGHERGLDHDEGVVYVLLVENMSALSVRALVSIAARATYL